MFKRGRLRITSLISRLKSNIITYNRDDVPTYITKDIIRQLKKGNSHIVISMCNGHEGAYKSLPEYLNEYHGTNTYWKLDFLHIAFEFTSERVKQRLGRYKRIIKIDVIELSDTDKRIIITRKGA